MGRLPSIETYQISAQVLWRQRQQSLHGLPLGGDLHLTHSMAHVTVLLSREGARWQVRCLSCLHVPAGQTLLEDRTSRLGSDVNALGQKGTARFHYTGITSRDDHFARSDIRAHFDHSDIQDSKTTLTSQPIFTSQKPQHQ